MSSIGASPALPATGPQARSQMATLAVVCTAVFIAVPTGTGEVKRTEEYPEGDTLRGDPRYQGENFDANVRAAEAVRGSRQ